MNKIIGFLTLIAVLTLSTVTRANTYTKADNNASLDQAVSWGGTAPGSGDIANWSGAYSANITTNSLLAAMPGSALSWQGFSVGTITGTALTTNTIYANITNITAATEAVVNGFNVVTITTKANHGFEPGQSVTIAGITPAGYNGTYIVAGAPAATQFTYTNATGSLAAGTTTLGTVSSAIYIGGAGTPTAGSALTIGSSGINLSSANVSVVVNNTDVSFNGNQHWQLAAGIVLRFSDGGVSGATARCATSGNDGLIEISGSGIASLNEGGASGFTDANSFSPFTGSWQVDSGATLRALRNGATAFGSGSITLNGGTLAVGGISGDVGNWTWNTTINLNPSTTSYISEHNVAGSGRSLLLTGAISGSGNLVFTEPLVGATTFTSQDLGFVLSGSDSMSGTITIGGPNENGVAGRLTYVRVGGNATGTATTVGAGAYGSLGTANVVNNGVLTFTETGALNVPGQISGTGTLRIGSLQSNTGTGGYVGDANQTITLNGANTYTGPTIINAGILQLATGASIANTPNITITTNSVNAGAVINTFDVSQLTSGFSTAAGQTLSLNGGQVTGSLTLPVGSTNVFAPGGSNVVGTLTITGNLTLSGGTNIMVMDINNSANDQITVGGNLTASGVTTFQFLPPNTGLNAGTYNLITASGTLTATPANFAISGLASGVRPQTFSIAVNGNAVQLVVVGSPGNLLWVGDGTANIWSTATTFSNWFNQVTSLKDIFVQNDQVTFDDTGSASPAINLTGSLAPSSVTVNGTQNYKFGGSGQIVGPGGLTMNNSGILTMNVSNSFVGPVLIGAGMIAITNESALGEPTNYSSSSLTLNNGGALLITNSLTLGINTNRGILIGTGGGTFDVTNGAAVTISSIVGDPSGSSVVTKTGNGTLTLNGNNNYGGGTIVNGGLVVCGTSHGLGLNGSWSPGFTLQSGVVDINGQGNYGNTNIGVNTNYLFNNVFITFAGNPGATMVLTDSVPGHAGFGVNGTASINNVITYNGANNPGKAIISAPWYAVGTGAAARTCVVEVDPTSATNISLECQGQMSSQSYEGKVATIQKTGSGVMEISSTNYYPNMQVTAGTLLVNNTYALGADRSPNYNGVGTGSPHKLIVDGGTVDLNGFSPSVGALSDNGGITTGLIDNNGASASMLTLGYSVSNTVNNASYAGVIADGTSVVSILKIGTNSQVLAGINTYSGLTTVSNGTLVVNTPGQIGLGAATNTVTVLGGAAGTLGGSGIINAPVVVMPGGTLAPAAGVAATVAVTISTNLTLSGTNIMNVNKDAATNDLVVLNQGKVNYGGTLVVLTNLMSSTTLALGDSFQLYSAPGYTGNFNSIVGSPGTGLSWNFNPASGILSVVTAMASNPTNITYVVTNSTMTLSWPSDHLGWLLQSQTNALSVGIGTNWADILGSDSQTQAVININSLNPAVFYRLRHP